MSLASYVTLGRSGLRVSPFTLGTMTFGEDLGWGASPEESARILSALDLTLSPEHAARLTEVSAPRLNFPAANNAALARLARNGGTTVDGVPTPPPPRLIQGARVY